MQKKKKKKGRVLAFDSSALIQLSLHCFCLLIGCDAVLH